MRWLLVVFVVVAGLSFWLAFMLVAKPEVLRDWIAASGKTSIDRSAASKAAPRPRESSTSTPAPKSQLTTISPIERRRIQAAIREARTSRYPQAAQPPVAPQPAAVPTDLSPEAAAEQRAKIRKQIAEVAPLLAECYELEVAKQPDLQGDLKLRFTIDGEPSVGGIVSESRVTGGSLSDRPELGTCIAETIYTLKFDPPEAGGTVEVEYPFVFGQKPK